MRGNQGWNLTQDSIISFTPESREQIFKLPALESGASPPAEPGHAVWPVRVLAGLVHALLKVRPEPLPHPPIVLDLWKVKP